MSIDMTCDWCGQPFAARHVRNRFCSKSCASLHQYRDRPKSTRKWTSPRTPVDNEHRKLRELMLPAAIGTMCPLRISDKCTGVMTDPAQMQLDHIVPRAQGGRSTRANARITCAACNHKRGAQLGGQVTSARHGHRHPRTTENAAQRPARTLPQW